MNRASDQGFVTAFCSKFYVHIEEHLVRRSRTPNGVLGRQVEGPIVTR